MKLKALDLHFFRNHEKFELSIAKPSLVFTGANGSGKTSLLEALAFFALARSFKTRQWEECIQVGQPSAKISLYVEQEGLDSEWAFYFHSSPKERIVKMDGAEKASTDILGHLGLVIFTPDQSLLMDGAPAGRRQWMDRILIQSVPHYWKSLASYQKALKQRNALLKNIQKQGAKMDWGLDIWDFKLATYAQEIWKQRGLLLEFLREPAREALHRLVRAEPAFRIQAKTDQENYLERLEQTRAQDIRMGSTGLGPHRDDWVFFLEERSMGISASRGEIRSAVLALKWAEMAWMEHSMNQKPLLLLDDVFSELDASRQGALLEKIQHYPAWLTTPELPDSFKNLDFQHVALS